MVAVMQPTLDDIIQDPAAGTGGFLIAANRYLREHSNPDRWTETQQRKYRRNTFYGMEYVQDAQEYLKELATYHADKTNVIARDRSKQALKRVRELMREDRELSAVARACILSSGDPRAHRHPAERVGALPHTGSTSQYSSA